MSDIRSKLNAVYSLEQLSGGDTAVHRVHPLAKLLVTLAYLVCVLSLGRRELARLTPFLFYPVVVLSLSGTPTGMILRRSLTALPFCLFAGLSNLILDRAPMLRIGGAAVSGGFVSFAALIFRTFLCVSAVLILVAVTPFPELTAALRRLRVPELLVTLIEMVYRYLGVLMEEASNMVTAFRLRSGEESRLRLRHFGPFVGQLLLRSADRAERIYHAMQCRGYHLRTYPGGLRRWNWRDWLFLALGVGSSIFFRLFDVVSLLGSAVTSLQAVVSLLGSAVTSLRGMVW